MTGRDRHPSPAPPPPRGWCGGSDGGHDSGHGGGHGGAHGGGHGGPGGKRRARAGGGKGRQWRELLAGIAAASALRPALVVVTWVVLAVISLAAAAMWLRVDTNPGHMIDERLDFRRDYNELIKAFPQLDNNFVVIVEAATPRTARAAGMAVERSFRARPDLFSHVFAPALSPMFDHYGPLWMETEKVRAMVERLKQAAPLLSALAEHPNLEGMAGLIGRLKPAMEAGRAPPMLGEFLYSMSDTVRAAAAGRTRVFDWRKLGGSGMGMEGTKRIIMVIKPRLDFSALDPAEKAMGEARRIADDRENTSGGRASITLTGEAAMNAEEFETVTEGAALAGLASFIIVTLVMAIGLPARRLVSAALALVIAGFALNAGFATLAVGELNMISVAFAVLFIGLGVDYAVHFLLRWLEERNRDHGAANVAITARAAAAIGPALVLAAMTTIPGFLAFTPTSFTGMAQLGIIAAGGIAIALAATLTLVPAVLRWLNIAPRPARPKNLLRMAPRPPAVPGRYLRPAVALLVIVAALASLPLLPKVRFDGDPVNLKDPASRAVQAFHRLLREEPEAVYSLSVMTSDGESSRLLARKLEQLPQVRGTRGIEDWLPKGQDEKLALLHSLKGMVPEKARMDRLTANGARLRALSSMSRQLALISAADNAPLGLRRAADRLRQSIDLFLSKRGNDAAAVSRLEGAMFVRLPELIRQVARLADAPRITVDNIDAGIRAWHISADGRRRLEVMPSGRLDSEAAMRDFARAVRSAAPNATGAPVEITRAADVISSAMLTAALFALVMVLVITAIMMRSLRGTLLVMAPIALAALLLAAYTVLFDAPFNFANVIVIPLLLGLGVDSAIHYVHRAREMRSGVGVASSSTPRAVIISGLTTIGSFGTLWITPHRGMSSMGELLSVSIALTLLTTLVVLPQIIEWAGLDRPGDGGS